MKRRDLFKGLAGTLIALAVKPLMGFPGNGPFRVAMGPTKHLIPITRNRQVEVFLPEQYLFYDVAGQTVFPRYASNGCPIMSLCLFLFPSKDDMARVSGARFEVERPFIIHRENGGDYASIEFNPADSDEEVRARIYRATSALRAFHALTI